MTVNQALTASNYCGIIYGSKQITFGVANRLAHNAKIYNKLMEEVAEIKNRGKERQETEDSIKEEVLAFGNSTFEGSFKEIDLNVIENLKYEEFQIKVGGSDKTEIWVLSDLLLVLQELEIIK